MMYLFKRFKKTKLKKDFGSTGFELESVSIKFFMEIELQRNKVKIEK